MSTNFHTPYVDGITRYRAVDMNIPLGELDEAIGNLSGQTAAAFVISYEDGALPNDGAEYNIMIPFPITFEYNLNGSLFYATDAATAETTITFEKNGVSFGTVVIAASGTSGTFSGDVTTFDEGDRLTVVFPATQDTTLAGINITLKATRLEITTTTSTTTTTTSTTTTSTTTTTTTA